MFARLTSKGMIWQISLRVVLCLSGWGFTALLAGNAPDAGQKAHPLILDRTGIRWCYPFSRALVRARGGEPKRLLLIKAAAGGTEVSGGL